MENCIYDGGILQPGSPIAGKCWYSYSTPPTAQRDCKIVIENFNISYGRILLYCINVSIILISYFSASYRVYSYSTLLTPHLS
ncbi:unnamed protein product [Tuber melanosporum]|uniref:(Perigord truffle) hypothetical protein n=1 Tax=Tuber melanosporum (strain Mel28) TaxID=656061 RepID=D5GHC3_TUBMM|nr:uncharacterized protein GSTUM_00007745001 [Tuber melanosporum]CAZ83875.1 unnamed protein product [Tuber melanosporum]